jgi:hypothetical protein
MIRQTPAPSPRAKNYGVQITAFAIFTILMLLGGGFYGYTQYNIYTEVQKGIDQGQSKATELSGSVILMKDAYSATNKTYITETKGQKDAIAAVFPKEEAYTALTRQLESYEKANNNIISNPFFMGSLTFGNAKKSSDTESKSYVALPFSVTLTTTRDNFNKFLSYVENSGSLEDGTRVMDVQQISINFPLKKSTAFGKEDEIQALNVNLSMNSYYQEP